MDSPSEQNATTMLPAVCPPSSRFHPTTFTSHRPPPLATTTPASPPPTNPSAPSSPPSDSSSSSSSSSPAPLVLSPSDLSSIVTLKRNYDTLTTQHSILLTTFAQRDTQLGRLHSQHLSDEAEWEQRAAASREQYERVMRDWSEESEKRHTVEESERQSKQQLEDATNEQRRAERVTRLLEADLVNERRMNELLREKIQQLDHQLSHLTASLNSSSSNTQPTTDESAEEEADVSLLSVHKAVLSRRVQRLELELTATTEQLAQQLALSTQQRTALNDIHTHLTALSQRPAQEMAASVGQVAGREGSVGDGLVMAEVECAVLRERLRCERRNGWQRERKLYCFVLVWLVALMAVSVGGLLYL